MVMKIHITWKVKYTITQGLKPIFDTDFEYRFKPLKTETEIGKN